MIVFIFILFFAVIFQSYLFVKERKLFKLIKIIQEKIIFKKLSIAVILYSLVEVIISILLFIYALITLGIDNIFYPNTIIYFAQFKFSAGILLILIFTISKSYMILDFIIDQSSYYSGLIIYYILHIVYVSSNIFSINFKVTLLDTWLSFNYKDFFEIGINVFSIIILYFIIIERRKQKKKFFENLNSDKT